MVHTEEISELAARLGSASLGELGSSASSSAASLTGRVYGKRQPHKEIPRKVNGGNECHSANDAEGSGSPTPSSTGDAQICFDFTKGACGRGENCRFSHDIATIVNVNSQERGICFDFVRGQCNRGLLCRFSHDLSNLSQHQPRASTSRDRPKSGAICFDFVKVC